jgi:hypothetical protein
MNIPLMCFSVDCPKARYLVEHDPGLSAWALAAISALNFLGYSVFRGANSQKVFHFSSLLHPRLLFSLFSL